VALVDFLESYYLTIDELNGAWHASYRAFDEIGRVRRWGPRYRRMTRPIS
jgi:hypothetical protein